MTESKLYAATFFRQITLKNGHITTSVLNAPLDCILAMKMHRKLQSPEDVMV